ARLLIVARRRPLPPRRGPVEEGHLSKPNRAKQSSRRLPEARFAHLAPTRHRPKCFAVGRFFGRSPSSYLTGPPQPTTRPVPAKFQEPVMPAGRHNLRLHGIPLTTATSRLSSDCTRRIARRQLPLVLRQAMVS